MLVILGGDDWLFDQREPNNLLPKHTSAKLNDEDFGFFKLSSIFFFIRQQVTTQCAQLMEIGNCREINYTIACACIRVSSSCVLAVDLDKGY